MKNLLSKYQLHFICLLLVVITIVPYSRALSLHFTSFDDHDYIIENRHVHYGLDSESIVWALTTGHSANWHPLTWVSHILDWQLYGSKPMGHHLTSIVFHLADVALLFMVLATMTRSVWRSAFVAALFAVHPLHVESVAWVSERKDVLSTCFWMLAMLAYVRYAQAARSDGEADSPVKLERKPASSKTISAQRPAAICVKAAKRGSSRKWFFLTDRRAGRWLDRKADACEPAGSALAAGLLAAGAHASSPKNSAGPLTTRRLIREKIPFFVLVLVSCVVTFWVQRVGGAMQAFDAYSAYSRIGNVPIIMEEDVMAPEAAE